MKLSCAQVIRLTRMQCVTSTKFGPVGRAGLVRDHIIFLYIARNNCNPRPPAARRHADDVLNNGR